MDKVVAPIIAELGGEILRHDDPRRPKGLRLVPSDVLVLLPTKSGQFPKLLVHITATYPHGTPDIYVPGDQSVLLTPHVGLNGLVCTRSYRVYANPDRPKDVLVLSIDEAVVILEKKYTDEERQNHFLSEAQAYWVTDDLTRLHYAPSLFSDTFVFQCSAERRGAKNEFSILKAKQLGAHLGIVGVRIDVPANEIEAFLNDPELWFGNASGAQDVLHRAIQALVQHHPPPSNLDLIFVFRIRTPEAEIFLGALAVQKLKLRKFIKCLPENWIALFHEQITEFRRILTEDVSPRRLVRRAAGGNPEQNAKFDAAAATRLAVIGCGSLGSHIIDLLLQGGIQTMYFSDKDWLLPENLARHTLPGVYLHLAKVDGLMAKALLSFPEFKGARSVGDIRLPEEQVKLLDWGPSLILCAAADQSVEMLLSNLVRRGALPSAWYCWVEPRLAAGHLVFQPAGSDRGLMDLYDETKDDWFYRHRVVKDGSLDTEREAGCQTAFTPFSGADAALFSAMCARKILECIDSVPKELTAFRWIPGSGGLEIMS